MIYSLLKSAIPKFEMSKLAIVICGTLFVWTAFGQTETQAQVCNWMTAASYYTHDATTMQRVNQYSPDPKVYHTPDPSVSSYRHQRSSLVVDGSIDQYHKVYRSGGEVRPYGEWQYPYRPYSVPFSDWAYGSPFGHLANPPRTNPILPPTLLVPGYQGYPGFGFGFGFGNSPAFPGNQLGGGLPFPNTIPPRP